MDLLDSFFLVKRNGVLYRAKISSLSSIILFDETKKDFYKYLDNLKASIESLTATADTILIPKSEMKANFTPKDTVEELSSNGNYVLTGDATKAIAPLYSNADLSGTNKWYDKQFEVCIGNIDEGYGGATVVINQKIEEIGDDQMKRHGTGPFKGDGKWAGDNDL